jgi:hypothetical protein
MNIRYGILALLLGSQISLAEQPLGAQSQVQADTLPTSQTDLPTTFTPAIDISEALTEKLDRQLEESTAKQPLPKAQWVSANLSPGR